MRRFGLVMLLAGCAQAPDVAEVPEAGVDPARCGADMLADYVGGPLTRLPGDLAVGTVRVIRPGDAVTMDFSETRLNVSLDGNDTITALSCG